MPHSGPRSALLAVVNRNFEGIEVPRLAQNLGLRHRTLGDIDPTIADILAADLLVEPTLVQGTGNLHFDAEAAAALGIPVILLIDHPGRHVQHAIKHAKDQDAIVAITVTAEELENIDALQEALRVHVEPVISAPVFEARLLDQARAAQAHIVLPEGDDDRILIAAHRLLAAEVVKLTILGERSAILNRATELGLDLSQATIINHLEDERLEEFAEQFYELRKAKGVTVEEARETVRDISYFATLMVHNGLADGMVSGAAHTTAHTIKPAFQIIKTAPGASVVSSSFLMVLLGRVWVFADCAVNPNPTADQLAEIAVISAETAAKFDIDPRVALLSYSTGSSGTGPDVDRCVAALAKARELAPDLKIDGPLQFDAAVDPGVAKKKMPDSEVAGRATVFIFPDLEAGNIGYKTAQRTGSALAVGPILQGLNKPINDLSRGATVPDIVNTVAITAIQAGGTS